MNNITMTAAGHRRAMNGNQKIRIELHTAYISRVYPSVGGARVEYYNAPGFFTDFDSVEHARFFVEQHNASLRGLRFGMGDDAFYDYRLGVEREIERFAPPDQQAVA